MKSMLEAVLGLGKALAQAGCKSPFMLTLPLPGFKALSAEVDEKSMPAPFSSIEEKRQQDELRKEALEGKGMATLQIWTEAGNAVIYPLMRYPYRRTHVP